jgi:predicted phosphodiesterase
VEPTGEVTEQVQEKENTLRILVLSDLHVDIGKFPVVYEDRRIDAGADVIVLAGDIHEGVQAPIWAREAFPDKPIVLVAGNHEFYGRYWNKNLRKIRDKAESLGIHFLERDSVMIDGVRFLGCTLWTDFEIHGDPRMGMSDARRIMNDYVRIKIDRQPGEDSEWREFRTVSLTPTISKIRHRKSVEWLQEQLAQGDPVKTVVVTHHAPHPNSVPDGYKEHELTPAYASDLTRLMGNSAVWIHGHIHENSDYVVNGTRVVANPRGYVGKTVDNPSFNAFCTIEV